MLGQRTDVSFRLKRLALGIDAEHLVLGILPFQAEFLQCPLQDFCHGGGWRELFSLGSPIVIDRHRNVPGNG